MSERHTSRKPLKVSEPEMRSGYDFSGAVRGKYYKRYMSGTNLVLLSRDVAEAFPTPEVVNAVLRSVMRDMPARTRRSTKRKRDIAADVLEGLRDMAAGRWARKTEFIPRKDGSFLRRITLRDGTVEKEHVVRLKSTVRSKKSSRIPRSTKSRRAPG